MDVPRKGAARKRRIRMTIYGVLVLVAVVLISMGLSRLKPAPPGVDKSTLWPDTVKRGPMDLQVRGLGTLVPLEIQWIAATTQGRVVKRLVLPGTAVKADTVLIQLNNPQLQQEAVDAEWQMKAAEADYQSLKVQLQSQELDQRSTLATAQSDYRQAQLQAHVDQQLASSGVASPLNAQLSEAKAQALDTRSQIEKKRLDISDQSVKAQLVAAQAKVEQLRALYDLKESQVERLQVRAGIDGVLQELDVEVGQEVTPGTVLCKVADPKQLKAELKIAETQAKDIQLNQGASIDTHNGIIPGHVIRIDPSVQNGTRTVDVKLDGELPPGAVPDLSVDGTIEIEHLNNVLYVGRPAFGQEDSTISLFKAVPDGVDWNNAKEAVRTQVKVGRASVNTIEILRGLKVGDVVVLSDMSRWDSFDRIRLQ
ncbi:MAG: efflux RND transporter periplasmic adaptor subunit [Terriglobia bacterium]